MSVYRALRTLVTDWPAVRNHLDAPTLARLADLIRQAGRQPLMDLMLDKATEIAWLVSDALPTDSPFRAQLRQPDLRGQQATVDADVMGEWFALVEQLGTIGVPAELAHEEPGPTMAEVAAAASAWLLAAPAYRAARLRTFGQDPDDPDLVSLTSATGERQWPAFQFDGTGQVWGVVRTVNRILDAADDPWGVADWWLGEHTRLSTRPVELIDRDADTALINAARAERTGA